jgi:hypothetical protein
VCHRLYKVRVLKSTFDLGQSSHHWIRRVPSSIQETLGLALGYRQTEESLGSLQIKVLCCIQPSLKSPLGKILLAKVLVDLKSA